MQNFGLELKSWILLRSEIEVIKTMLYKFFFMCSDLYMTSNYLQLWLDPYMSALRSNFKYSSLIFFNILLNMDVSKRYWQRKFLPKSSMFIYSNVNRNVFIKMTISLLAIMLHLLCKKKGHLRLRNKQIFMAIWNFISGRWGPFRHGTSVVKDYK